MAEQEANGTGKPEKTRTVLIAMDGSKHAEYAFELARCHVWNERIYLVVRKPGCIIYTPGYAKNVYKPTDEVIMAYCAEHLSSYPPTAMMAGNPAVIQSMVKEHEDHVKKVFKHIDDMAKKHDIEHKLERLLGSPGDSIIKAAEEQNVDLIVVGSRGQGALRRTILGSISDYIIHHSHVPVMICKHEDEHHKIKG